MKILEAVEREGSVRLTVHLDETKQVRDPQQAEPPEGEKDTRPLVADPDYVMEVQWGAVVPAAVVKRETALLGAAELARRGSRKVAALDGAALGSARGTDRG